MDNVGSHAVAGDDQERDHEHHPEKKSILNKVKARAKKMKDTLKLHSYNHDQDHTDHGPADQDLDEEDEERFEDPEVDGATIDDSTALRFPAIPGQVQSSGKSPGNDFERSKVDPGKSSVQGEEFPQSPRNTPISVAPGTDKDSDPAKNLLHEKEDPRKPRANLGDLEEDPHGQNNGSDSYNPSNHQTKVTDPTITGGEEAEITPILHHFDKMNISEVAEQERETEEKQRKPIEPEKQFPDLPTGSHDHLNPKQSPPRSLKTEDNPHDVTAEKPSSQGSYTQKISPISTSIADKAITAKNVVDSKIGYGEKGETTRAQDTHEEEEKEAKPASPVVEYGKKIAAMVTEKLNPVYEKVAETGNMVMSKMKVSQSPKTGNEVESESEVKGQDKGASMKDYFAEKLRPGEEERALSEVISGALGKKGEEETKPMGKVTESEEVARRLGKTDDQSEERLDSGSVNSPGTGVVDKVKGAGVTESEGVARRLGKTDDQSEEILDSGSVNSPGTGVVDKVKGAEVTESEEVARRLGKTDDQSEEILDSGSVNSPGTGVVDKVKGAEVTESEEVARPLGKTDDQSEERLDSGSVNSPGTGMVDKVKGAVSSWFNKGEESQPTQQSPGSSHGE